MRLHGFPLWILPIISAVVWFGMLWAMLIYWLVNDRPTYPSMESSFLAYISDIGAYTLKPLFIAGAAVTATFFWLSLLAMRLNQSLPRWPERIFDVLALLTSLMGAVSLVLLAVFDTYRYSSRHRLFLFLFMLGVALSALFTTLEYRRLGRTFTNHPVLKYSYVGKAIILVAEVGLSIAFGVCLYKKYSKTGAILEWVIAFIFTLYVLTFVADLIPRARTKHELRQDMREKNGSSRAQLHQNMYDEDERYRGVV